MHESQEKILSDTAKYEFDNPKLSFGNSILSRMMLFLFVMILFSLIFFGLNFVPKVFEKPVQIIANSNQISASKVIEDNQNTTKYYDTYYQWNFPRIDDYSARSIVVYDLNSNRSIYEKYPDAKLFIASLTKLASTKILAEEVNLEDDTTITDDISKIGGSPLEMKSGQVYSNQDLLKASVIVSSNQAVFAMQDPNVTVNEMNTYAHALRLSSTNFSNPAGFDDDNNNYSTARELIPIAKLFFENSTLKDYAGTVKSEVTDLKENKTYKMVNTNELLRNDYYPIIAGKTGTTPRAGQNLALLVEKNNRRYIIILIGSSDRYKDAMQLMDRL